MQVEIWSDVACPWCAVGKRRFEAALDNFEHPVSVRWRSFELDPSAPPVKTGDYVDLLAAKYGGGRSQAQQMIDRMTEIAAGEGLDFDFSIIRPGNTFDAHRLLHLAADRGIQDAIKERFLLAYLGEGAAIGDPDVLAELAVDAGLEADEVALVLDSDKYAEDVHADEQQAHANGITGVPFFVVDRRSGVSGAQPPEVVLRALRRAHVEASPLAVEDGPACTDGACAV